MRVAATVMCILMSAVFAEAQATVQLLNVTAPNTPLEVGQRAQVLITGAEALAPVVFNLNGINYSAGSTDASGNFSVITNPLTGADVNSWTEYWYVNGVPITPLNANPTWLAYAPTLPNFDVNPNLAYDCAPPLSISSACGGYSLNHWIYSPLVVYNTNTALLGSSDISSAVSSWNSVESHLSFSSDASHRFDLFLFSTSSLPTTTFAVTYFYGVDCTACLNTYVLCSGSANGTCQYSSTIQSVDVAFNNSAVTTQASYLGVSAAYVGKVVLEHEMGHALGLAHVGIAFGICSETKDIMVQGISNKLGCGINAPQAACDTGAVYAIYPSAVASCSTSAYAYCSAGSC